MTANDFFTQAVADAVKEAIALKRWRVQDIRDFGEAV